MTSGSLGLEAQTILTDTAILEKYRHLAIEGAPPQRTGLPHLTAGEQALYAYLAEYAASHGTWLLLEQERIPWSHAYPVLAEAMACIPRRQHGTAARETTGSLY